MLHVGQPFEDQQNVCPFNVAGEMFQVGDGQLFCVRSGIKFFSKMEYRPEEIRKGLMFQQIGVFEEPEQKSPFADKEIF